MRILITGASGFVGRRLVAHSLAAGDTVSGTYLGEAVDLGCPAWEADVLDRQALERVVADVDPEVVIHLAGLSHVGASWEALADYFRINVLGTENLLAAAAGRRVLLASSADVYGRVPDAEQPITEDRLPAPATPYGMTKAAAERLALARGAVVVRSFNLIGPGQSPQFAFPSFAAQLARIAAGREEPILRVGNLEARRDFLHVDDAASAYRLLAEKASSGTIYNLGSGRHASIREGLDVLLEVAGVAARVETDPERMRPLDVPLLQADTSRLAGLGWTERCGMRKALEDLWRAASG